jgi:hypothetical protein
MFSFRKEPQLSYAEFTKPFMRVWSVRARGRGRVRREPVGRVQRAGDGDPGGEARDGGWRVGRGGMQERPGARRILQAAVPQDPDMEQRRGGRGAARRRARRAQGHLLPEDHGYTCCRRRAGGARPRRRPRRLLACRRRAIIRVFLACGLWSR